MSILDLVIDSEITGHARYELAIRALSICDQVLKGDDHDTVSAAVMDLVERAKSKQDIDRRVESARMVG